MVRLKVEHCFICTPSPVFSWYGGGCLGVLLLCVWWWCVAYSCALQSSFKGALFSACYWCFSLFCLAFCLALYSLYTQYIKIKWFSSQKLNHKINNIFYILLWFYVVILIIICFIQLLITTKIEILHLILYINNRFQRVYSFLIKTMFLTFLFFIIYYEIS